MLQTGGEHRPKWSKHVEFVLTCIGYSVGFGNIWRFPYLCYTNHGGSFLIPYMISYVIIGIPIFFLEIAMAQFSSRATLTLWEINKSFKGLGISMLVLSVFIMSYYSVLVAISFYYLLSSFASTLPWVTCDNEFNTCHCRDEGDLIHPNDYRLFMRQAVNCTDTTDYNEFMLAEEEYLYYNVLKFDSGKKMDPSIQVQNKWNFNLIFCNLFIWVIVFAAILRPVKAFGKFLYITTLLPYAMTLVLLLKGLTLPGAQDGIDLYMNLDTSKLLNSQIWSHALTQILFSLGCCSGSLLVMASHNKFNANCVRDSIIIPTINVGSSVFMGFTVFAIIGFIAKSTERNVKNINVLGPGLIFVTYPVAISKMPVPQLWSFLFFLTLTILGLGSHIPNVETFAVAIQDQFLELREKPYSILFRAAICIVGFLIGLPQCSKDGFRFTSLVDNFIEIPLIVIALFEVMVLVWIYGPDRFREDLSLMLGKRGNWMIKRYLKPSLNYLTAAFLMFTLLYGFIDYHPYQGTSKEAAYGWLMVMFILVWIFVWFGYYIHWSAGQKIESDGTTPENLLFLIKQVTTPGEKWGPHKPAHRATTRYETDDDVIKLQRKSERKSTRKTDRKSRDPKHRDTDRKSKLAKDTELRKSERKSKKIVDKVDRPSGLTSTSKQESVSMPNISKFPAESVHSKFQENDDANLKRRTSAV